MSVEELIGMSLAGLADAYASRNLRQSVLKGVIALR